MKPLAVFAGILVVGLAVIFAVLRLTAHPASADPLPVPQSSLTKSRFVRTGNGTCARYYQQLEANFEGRPRPNSRKMYVQYLRIAIPLAGRLDAGLRALVPPRRDAAAYRRLLRGAAQEVSDARAALHAFESGQVRRGQRIERDGDHLSNRLNSLSRKVGLTICGLTGPQVSARYG